jgi:hypothetical protein
MPRSLVFQRPGGHRAAGVIALLAAVAFTALAAAADPPRKNLILPGEVFEVAGKMAFLFSSL